MLELVPAPPRHTQGCSPKLKGQRCSNTLPHDQPVITRPMSKSLAPSVGRTVFPPNIHSWHELASLGCFVYCYLRVDGSPYYVGIAKLACRPLKRQKRDTKPPRDHARVRVMRHSLTWEEACSWECFYIQRYGRKDIGTGILRNKTNGGDGVLGVIPRPLTSEERLRMSKIAKRRGMPDWVARRGRAAAQRVVAEKTAQRRLDQANALGISVDELLVYRQKEHAKKAQAARHQRRLDLGMTVAGYRRWMADGQPVGDLTIYQAPRKSGRQEWTEEQRAQTAALTKAHYEAQAAAMGMTLEQRKVENRKNKYLRMMQQAKEMGMTKRQHAAWVTAGRPSLQEAAA